MRIVKVRRGFSARQLTSVALILVTLTFALITAFLIVLLTRPHDAPPSWITFGLTLLYGWIASAVLTGVAVALTSVVVRKELALGYTSNRGFPDTMMVDPGTGIVLREAGSPILSRSEYRQALANARAWVREHPDMDHKK